MYSHRDFILRTFCISFLPIMQKERSNCNLFSKIYQYYLKIHMLFTPLRHLNFMCFDIWATKTKLCVLS